MSARYRALALPMQKQRLMRLGSFTAGTANGLIRRFLFIMTTPSVQIIHPNTAGVDCQAQVGDRMLTRGRF